MSTAVPAFSYPIGVRALLPVEARRHRAIDLAIVQRLEARDFEEIVLPMIDFVDPYANALDRELQRSSYRFTDREGELVAVRSDFTPMVARAIAPSLDRFPLPLHIYYRGDVIRCEPNRLGPTREFYQVGAELIGDGSPQADYAMLELATSIVSSLGVQPTVVINDTSIVAALIRCCGGTAYEDREVRRAVARKQSSALEGAKGDPACLQLLRNLASGSATIEQLSAQAETSAAAGRLSTLLARARQLDDAKLIVSLDDIEEEAGYYTGIRFRLFDSGTRLCVGQGGRYDTLYARFGASAEAIGFTLTVDYLDAVREKR